MVADTDFFEACSSSYGYSELAGFSKGNAMQSLYTEFKKLLKSFYANPKDATYGFENRTDKKHCWFAGAIDFKPYQLSWDEALITLQAVYADYPLLFFSDIYKTGGSLQAGIIKPIIDAECARGDFRQFYVRKVEEKIAELAAESNAQGRKLAMGMYRAIRDSCRYDYNKGKVATYVDIPSHSILSYVRSWSAVCQGFARTYQALMNYLSIPTVSIGVITAQGTKHSCNLAFLADERKWVMVDCTVGKAGDNDSGFDIPPGTYQQMKRDDGNLEYDRHRMEFNSIWEEYLGDSNRVSPCN